MAPKPMRDPYLLITAKTRPFVGEIQRYQPQSLSFGLQMLDLEHHLLPSKRLGYVAAVERPLIYTVPPQALRTHPIGQDFILRIEDDFLGHFLVKSLVSFSLKLVPDFHCYHYFDFNSHSQRGNLS